MDKEEENDRDQSPEHWLNPFEMECLQQLDSEPNMEDAFQAQRDYAAQKLFVHFQNSATSVAELYKGISCSVYYIDQSPRCIITVIHCIHK